MKKSLLVSASAVFLTLTPKISAASDYLDNYNDMYFGIGGSFLNIDVDATYHDSGSVFSGSGSADGAGMIGAFAGYQFNPWISGEVRGYFGVSDGDFEGVDVEVSKFFAIYARPTLPIHEYFSLYGLFGYGVGTVKSLGESDSESDFTYGAGIEVGKGTNVKLQIEYAVFHDEDYSYRYSDTERLSYNVKISGVNANLVWYF